MRILISGGSGFVGTALTAQLRKAGHSVGHLVRPGGKIYEGDVRWDPPEAAIDVAAMQGVDTVVHLSGASIADGRWTPQRKAILRSSRIDSTRVLVDAIANLRRKPAAFICASAIGYYGDRGNEVLTETSEPGPDFLALLVRDWEAEALRAEAAGIRTARLRFGIILSANGGALSQMLLPFKFFIGGRLGSGSQWMSWIALEDAVNIVRSAIEDEKISGPINVVAPNPVQNAEFARIAGKVLHRPAVMQVPAFVLRLGLGEMADSLLLASQGVVPGRLIAIGYKFRFETLEPALRAILSRP
jgi:uncharacterized protein